MLGFSDPEPLARAAVRVLRALPRPAPLDRDTVSVLRQVVAGLDTSLLELRLEYELALRLVTEDWGRPSVGELEDLLHDLVAGGSSISSLAQAYIVGEKLGNARWARADAVSQMIEAALDPEAFFTDDALASRIQFSAMLDLIRCGRFETAESILRNRITWSRHEDGPQIEGPISALLGLSLLLQGQLSASEDACRRTLAARPEHRGHDAVLAETCLLNVFIEQGRMDEARELEHSLTHRGRAEPDLRLFVAESLARLHIAEGQLRRGLGELLAVGSDAEQHGINNPAVTSWRHEAARAYGRLGRTCEAQRLADEAVELARAFGEVRALGATLRAAAEVAEPHRQVDLLSEAAGLLEPSTVSLEAAHALVDLGVVLCTAGRRDEARAALRRGAHLASLCGADTLVEVSSNQLRAAGARPRRLVMTGLGALTPAERRVVTLAAEHNTNAGIAASLYVTEKTVEGHLARAYNKLGIRSRQALPALLALGELDRSRTD
jgi:DNA-binding CsgD family transcriptional regulator